MTGDKGVTINGPELILLLIENLRKEEGVSVAKLTYGLYDEASYSRALHQKNKRPDKLLIDALYQRLGKNMRNFECLLDAEEYALFEMREEFRDSFFRNDIIKAKKAMHRYLAVKEDNNLHHQLALLFEISIMVKQKENHQMVIDKAYKAIRTTIPGFELSCISDYLFSEVELILLNILLKENQDIFGEDYVAEYLETVYEMFRSERYSDNEQVMRFAPMIYRLVLIKIERKSFEEAIEISEYMIKCLVADNKINYLMEFLRCKSIAKVNAVMTLSDMDVEKESLLHSSKEYNQACAISDIYEKYYPEWNPESEIQIYWELNIIPTGKIVKQRRELFGLSQEELTCYDDEVICSVDTISRLENGKHQIKSSVEKRILDKLRIIPDRFHREFMTDQYKDIRTLKRLISARIIQNEKETRSEIERLEEVHKTRFYNSNVRYLEYIKLAMSIDGEAEQELLKKYEKQLWMTMPRALDNSFKVKCLPFETEYYILMKIAKINLKIGNLTSYFSLIHSVLDTYRSVGKYDNTFWYNIASLERTLSSELGNRNRFDESNDLARHGLNRCIRFDRLDMCINHLYCLAWNEDMDERVEKKSKQTELCASFALADLEKRLKLMERVKKQCRLFYDDNILVGLI